MNAVLYCRFSPRPDAGKSPSNRLQFQHLRRHCAERGHRIVSVRWDRDLSGGRSDNRPGLHRAVRDACRWKATLVVYSLDRLARETADHSEIVRKLIRAGADLESATEHFDIRDEMGEAMAGMMAIFAQLERRRISRKTRDAMQQHQRNGRRMGRLDRCPWGWQPDLAGPTLEGRDGVKRLARMVLHPEEQATLEKIRALHAEGLGVKAITARLDDEMVPCRGRRWHVTTVRKLLRRIQG